MLCRKKATPRSQADVDHKCIDCDTCRWMAPQVFTRVDEQSAVYKQPSTEKERLNALQGIFDCGYHSEESYGATSYFITHPDGNILVDSPRYTERLAHRIETLGGARYMFLTQVLSFVVTRDDVAYHDKWSKRLGCDRVLHSQDVKDHTDDVEIKLEGGGPWNLGNDFELIHTPGHTRGSVCLLYKLLKVLFAGDHISKDQSGLFIGEQYNQQSVPLQLESVRKLLDFEFEWILPGHGRRVEFKDAQEKNEALKAFLVMKGEEQAQSV
ncbi:hypothetical protein MKX01_017412 [Papaver californicum]|nr:hypothetical protein MKX01_017412 [Papaver californicum]